MVSKNLTKINRGLHFAVQKKRYPPPNKFVRTTNRHSHKTQIVQTNTPSVSKQKDDHLEILKQIIPFWNNLDGRLEILKQIIQIWNNLSRHLEIPEQIVNSAIDHNSTWEAHH